MSADTRICARCVLGSDDRCAISFDADGVCNYCREFEQRWVRLQATETARKSSLDAAVARVRRSGKGRPYDSILGMSGGIDSTYLAYLAAKCGLRPLVVHFDNGWNSEIAVQNVERAVRKLGFDLETYVIDWEDFRAMQLAYLRASVVDIEVLTDHAIFGTLYKIALEKQIPFILSGSNEATEGILPVDWVFNKKDHVNIKAIYREYGDKPLSSFPFLDYRAKRRIARSGVEIVELLDIVDYQVAEAREVIQSELGWRDYGGKHYESIWTRFYQGYILPRKFGIDKRKAHLATLINSGQLTRDEALERLRAPIYPPELFERDYDFALKKLGLTQSEFDEIMALPIRSHREFDTEGSLFSQWKFLQPIKPVWEYFKAKTGLDRDRLRRLSFR